MTVCHCKCCIYSLAVVVVGVGVVVAVVLFVCLLAWLVAVVSLQVEASPLGVTKALDHCVPQMQKSDSFFRVAGTG